MVVGLRGVAGARGGPVDRSCARQALAVLAVMTVSGCAVGPDFAPPPPPPDAGYSRDREPSRTVSAPVAGGQAQRLVRGRDIPGDWWDVFHSRTLTALIGQAIKNNPDLRAAQAALWMARNNMRAGAGAFFPTVDANFTAARGVAPLGSPDDPGEPLLNTFTGQVQVSYVPDVFGATRRAVELLQAQADNQRFQLEATYLTLTTNLVLAVIQEASVRGQIEATQQIIKLVSDLLVIFRRQRSLGQIADADVVAQEAALAQIEETLPPLQRQLEQQRHLITALVGNLPTGEPHQTFVLGALYLPRDLPLSLPSKLVEQRPDIRAAEETLHSASAQIGVAVANRLPNIALTANPGSTAFSIDQVFAPGTGWWNISASVTQPLFHGGTLLFQEWAARDAFDQAAAQYRSTVVTAFQNVADSLTALRTDALALQKAVEAEQAAKRSLDITRESLRLGAINYLTLINAQQTYQQALLTRVQAQSARYADTAALFQALGGGWWNRNDVLPEPERPIFSPFK